MLNCCGRIPSIARFHAVVLMDRFVLSSSMNFSRHPRRRLYQLQSVAVACISLATKVAFLSSKFSSLSMLITLAL